MGRTNTSKDEGMSISINGLQGERGQSEIIGTAMIIGIIVTAGLSAFGMAVVTLNEYQSHARTLSSEDSMAQFSGKAKMVSIGSSSNDAIVNIGSTQHGSLSVQDSGNMKVTIINQKTGSETVILNQKLGAIQYTNTDNNRKVAYQGGGVWKKSKSGTVMVSPPSVNYEGKTLTLPVTTINTENSEVGPGKVSISKTGEERIFPDQSAGYENPVKNSKIEITITSDYYEGWGRFFESRTISEVTYNHDKNKVNILLKAHYEGAQTNEASASTSAGTVKIQGGNGESATDSYDSSEAPYAVKNSEEGDLVARGDVTISGSEDFKGDVISGGQVKIRGGVTVKGNVHYTDKPAPDDRNVEGWIRDGANVPDLEPVDPIVNRMVQNAKSDNDNDQTNAISGNTLQSGTITSGTYYVTSADLNSETVTMDTSGGDITLIVDGNIDLSKSNIKVTDPDIGKVQVFTTGDMTVSDSKVGDVETDRSPAFQVYGLSGMDITINKGSDFVGLIYAPSANANKGKVMIEQSNTDVYGAVVAGGNSFTIKNGATVHFDKALKDREPLSEKVVIPPKTYIHLFVKELTVQDA